MDYAHSSVHTRFLMTMSEKELHWTICDILAELYREVYDNYIGRNEELCGTAKSSYGPILWHETFGTALHDASKCSGQGSSIDSDRNSPETHDAENQCLSATVEPSSSKPGLRDIISDVEDVFQQLLKEASCLRIQPRTRHVKYGNAIVFCDLAAPMSEREAEDQDKSHERANASRTVQTENHTAHTPSQEHALYFLHCQEPEPFLKTSTAVCGQLTGSDTSLSDANVEGINTIEHKKRNHAQYECEEKQEPDSSITRSPSPSKRIARLNRAVVKLRSPYKCPAMNTSETCGRQLEDITKESTGHETNGLQTLARGDTVAIKMLKRPFRRHVLKPRLSNECGKQDLRDFPPGHETETQNLQEYSKLMLPTQGCENISSIVQAEGKDTSLQSRPFSKRSREEMSDSAPGLAKDDGDLARPDNATPIVCKNSEMVVKARQRKRTLLYPARSFKSPSQTVFDDADVDHRHAMSVRSTKTGLICTTEGADLACEKQHKDTVGDTNQLTSKDWETANGNAIQISRDPELAAEWHSKIDVESAPGGLRQPARSAQTVLERRLAGLRPQRKGSAPLAQDATGKRLMDEQMALDKQLRQVKESLKLAESALRCEQRTERASLEHLIGKWRRVAQTACDEFFVYTRTRIEQAGGLREWQHKQRSNPWTDDDTSMRTTELENRDEFEPTAEEKEAMGITNDDFSMTYMIDMMGIPADLVGWDREDCCWK